MSQVHIETLKSKITFTGLALFITIFVLAGQAAAQIPQPNVVNGGNKWRITAYNDLSPVHQQLGQQDICFLPFVVSGTNIVGSWYSTTYPNWRGRYSQEGDRVLMHGNWGNFIGSDGMQIELFQGTSTRDVGAGHWTEWFNFGTHGFTIGYANARLERIGKCLTTTNGADPATLSQADFERMSEDLSSKVSPRLRADGKESDHPADAAAVPLPEERENQ